MGSLVTVDPGEDTGWSKWVEGRLVRCGLAHPVDYPELPFTMGLDPEPPDLVIEMPKDYQQNRKVDPDNLISLGYKVGTIYGVFAAYYHLHGRTLNRELVYPYQWKGQVPKNIYHDRHLPALTPGEKTVLLAALERTPKGKRHDVKDAVCLGLWRLHR